MMIIIIIMIINIIEPSRGFGRRVHAVGGIRFATPTPIRQDAHPKNGIHWLIGTIPRYRSTQCWWLRKLRGSRGLCFYSLVVSSFNVCSS